MTFRSRAQHSVFEARDESEDCDDAIARQGRVRRARAAALMSKRRAHLALADGTVSKLRLWRGRGHVR